MTESENIKNCLSLHIYDDNLDSLLSQAIVPLIKNINDYLISFFFIRYGEGGKHIRLRLFIKDITVKTKLKSKIECYFNYYFQSNNLKRSKIIFTQYNPEYDRYGGEKGIIIAEQQFYLSSSIILDFLRKEGNLSYQKCISKAILLNLQLCYSFNLDVNQIIEFQTKYYERWSPYLYHSKSRILKKVKKTIAKKHFKHLYSKQKSMLYDSILSEWKSLNLDKKKNETEMRWVRKNIEVYNLCLKLTKDLNPKYSQGFSISNNKKGNSEFMLSLLDSYIHMTNNRLGISNQDESFIAYILKEIFLKYSKNKL